jgi:hypothetical protein
MKNLEQLILAAAVCRAAGLNGKAMERAYGDQVLTEVDKRYGANGSGLLRTMTHLAKVRGVPDPSPTNMRLLLNAAFGVEEFASVSPGLSTYNAGEVLGHAANAFIVDAFSRYETTWRRVSSVRPVADFKEVSGYALTGDLIYRKMGPGAEVKHGSVDAEGYGNRADHYALMLSVDYRDIRNDDLGAFTAATRNLGRGGSLTVNDLFWAELLAGQGTFWSVSNGNYLASTSYALTQENLPNLSKAWGQRTDPAGRPMGDGAKFLLAPNGLDMTARRLMVDTGNPWQVETSCYMGNAAYEGSSEANYFLVGDPEAGTPVVEVVFLDGQEEPIVGTVQPDAGTHAIQFLGSHAFGVRKQAPQGAIKFKPTAD